MSNSESRNPEVKDPLYWCRLIEDLAAGWDEEGATGPKSPYEWETIARMAMDYARAAIKHTSSESAKPDSGTVKILTDLLDRAYKMHVMAGTATYLAAQDADQNDPLLAWLSDVRSVLYGKTKLEPRVPTSGERPEIGTSQK